MNLTLSQAFDRTKDMSGEIKAAAEMVRVTERELAHHEHTAMLARTAHEKAVAAHAAKLDERQALADHIRELTLQVGETQATESADPLAGVDFLSHYANGEAKLNAVFDEATNP